MTRWFLAGFILLCPLRGQAEDAIGPMPWHLVDYWFDFGKEQPFDSYSVDIEIKGAVDPKIRLYIAPVGIGHLNKTPFYGGIQTQSDGFDHHPHKKRSYIGKGCIFSRWNDRDFDTLRPAVGGLFESGGYEGHFTSVRNRFDWSEGRYTWTVRRMERVIRDGKISHWVGGFVYDHTRDREQYIGALRFEGETLTLSRKLAAFLEIYGRRIPLEQIPQVAVTFSNWKINGAPAEPIKASAIYPRNVPQVAVSTVKGKTVTGILGAKADRSVEGIRKDARNYHQQLW